MSFALKSCNFLPRKGLSEIPWKHVSAQALNHTTAAATKATNRPWSPRGSSASRCHPATLGSAPAWDGCKHPALYSSSPCLAQILLLAAPQLQQWGVPHACLPVKKKVVLFLKILNAPAPFFPIQCGAPWASPAILQMPLLKLGFFLIS